MFYLNSTLNFGIPPVLVFQLEVYYKEDRLLTSLTAQQKGTTARWYSNKTSLVTLKINNSLLNSVLVTTFLSSNSAQVTVTQVVSSLASHHVLTLLPPFLQLLMSEKETQMFKTSILTFQTITITDLKVQW